MMDPALTTFEAYKNPKDNSLGDSGTRKEVELNKSLVLLGFGAWQSLEPKTERESDGYVEEKLNKALSKKMDIVDVKRQKEQKEKSRLEKSEKEKVPQKGRRTRRASIAAPEGTEYQRNKRRPSLVDEERKLHEAYQLILSEHHRRLTKREQKMSKEQRALAGNAITAWQSKTHHNCPCIAHRSKHGDCSDEACESSTNRKQHKIDEVENSDEETEPNAENSTEKDEFSINAISHTLHSLQLRPESNSRFKTQVKKLKTASQVLALTEVLAEKGTERFNLKKLRMESNLGINH